MFGYIVVHKPELKVKEYETYRASYCGLCHSLKKQSGRIGQLTLSFDMTFLALLLVPPQKGEREGGKERKNLVPILTLALPPILWKSIFTGKTGILTMRRI